MTPRRFQVDDISKAVIRVSGEQARHALRVLRLKEGALVYLFDGSGGEVEARITWRGADEFEVSVLERRAGAARTGPQLSLAVAMPKGPRGDWLVEKCAELGVSRLIPLASARSQVEPGEGKLERWRRKAVEAAKQSGQTATMIVDATTDLAGLLDQIPRPTRIYYGAPQESERTLGKELQAGEPRRDDSTSLLMIIGPEGGLTEEETHLIESAGGKGVRLAPTILRIETAAVAAAAIWACRGSSD
jgi:16S rRNA (uracil1498-N3)-methyltransferase